MKLLTPVFITQSCGCGFLGLEGKNAIHYPSPLHDFENGGNISKWTIVSCRQSPMFLGIYAWDTFSLFSSCLWMPYVYPPTGLCMHRQHLLYMCVCALHTCTTYRWVTFRGIYELCLDHEKHRHEQNGVAWLCTRGSWVSSGTGLFQIITHNISGP